MISAFLVGTLAGCHVQRPVSPLGVQPGEELTVVLSEEGRDRLSATSTRGGDEVTGRLVSVTSDSLSIAARLDALAAGGMVSRPGLRQTLTFSLDDIERVTTPELNRGRTVAVVGALVAVTTWLVIELFNVGDGGPGPVTPPPPPPAPLRPGG